MTEKPKYSTIHQHQPLYTPKSWDEEGKRFVRTLQGILEDIYKRYGRLGLSDLSKVFRGKVTGLEGSVDGLESGLNTAQGNITTLGEAFAQMNNLIAQLNEVKLGKSEVLNAVYPVGAIYLSVNSASPQELFGGTWERLKDRFLLGAGDTYAAGATGGEATHTLTGSEMPNHNHTQRQQAGNGGIGKCVTDPTITPGDIKGMPLRNTTWSDGSSQAIVTEEAGGSKAHNNMPPYLAVYMWKRTA